MTTFNDVYKVLKQLEETKSRKEKESILRESLVTVGSLMEDVLTYAFHPYKQWNFRLSDEDYLDSEIYYDGTIENNLFNLLDQAIGRNKDKEYSFPILYPASRDKETFEVVKRIVNKNLECGVGIKTAQKFVDIPEHQVMTSVDDFEAFMQNMDDRENYCYCVNLNGVRCWSYYHPSKRTLYLSRNGHPLFELKVFNKEIQLISEEIANYSGEEVILDGEIVNYDSEEREFWIYDCPTIKNLQLHNRYDIIKTAFEKVHKKLSRVKLLQHSQFVSMNHIIMLTEDVIKKGGKGLITKDWRSEYIPERSNLWCKVSEKDI